jgi:hypothetical protein
MPPEAVTSPPYREGLGIGGCLFSFFSLRQRKEHTFQGLALEERNMSLSRQA